MNKDLCESAAALHCGMRIFLLIKHLQQTRRQHELQRSVAAVNDWTRSAMHRAAAWLSQLTVLTTTLRRSLILRYDIAQQRKPRQQHQQSTLQTVHSTRSPADSYQQLKWSRRLQAFSGDGSSLKRTVTNRQIEPNRTNNVATTVRFDLLNHLLVFYGASNDVRDGATARGHSACPSVCSSHSRHQIS